MKTKTPETLENHFWQISLTFPPQSGQEIVEDIMSLFNEDGNSAFLKTKKDRKSHILEIVTPRQPEKSDIQARLLLFCELNDYADLFPQIKIDIENLPDRNWLMHVHKDFPPITIGDFFVYGSHYTGDLPADLMPLHIDAATAFGSGEHGTTEGCLQALQNLNAQGHEFKNILDMGCGSGILGIAAVKIWPNAKMTAVDIDPESIAVTQRHATLNQCEEQISCASGDGYHTTIVSENGDYDLIIANILTKPLIQMASDLANNLKSGGYAVLSGLLIRQKSDVLNAHEKHGLTFVDGLEKENWQSLILHKP